MKKLFQFLWISQYFVWATSMQSFITTHDTDHTHLSWNTETFHLCQELMLAVAKTHPPSLLTSLEWKANILYQITFKTSLKVELNFFHHFWCSLQQIGSMKSRECISIYFSPTFHMHIQKQTHLLNKLYWMENGKKNSEEPALRCWCIDNRLWAVDVKI